LDHSSLSHPPIEVGLWVGIFVGSFVGDSVGALDGGGVGHATSARLVRMSASVAYSAKMYGSLAGMFHEIDSKYWVAIPLPMPTGTMRFVAALSQSISSVRSTLGLLQRHFFDGLPSVRKITTCSASAR
jgi:hypothetical protein